MYWPIYSSLRDNPEEYGKPSLMDAFRTTDMIWKEKSYAYIMEYTVKYCI